MRVEHEAKTNNQAVESRGMKLWQKIAIGILIALIAIILIVNMATSGVTKVSNDYIKDIQSKNADAAYSLMTKEAQAATDRQQFRELVDKIGPILNTDTKMTSKEVSGETGQAATGKVTYEIKGTDGVTYKITVNLQKEDGEWRVLNFESEQ